jgi:endonuclease/exonuclease/phosphatase family metal-dependent hydrolase
LKKFIINTVISANLVIIFAMLLTGFADLLDPRSWPIIATGGYAFPVFALINFGMIVVWMFISKKHILIPFLGFVVGYVPMMQFCPVHASGDAPLGALKVMTFNTWGFGSQREPGNDEAKREIRRKMLQYIVDEDCHVVCLQEAGYHHSVRADIDSIVTPKMPYLDTCKTEGGSTLMILSKYPILKHELLKYKSKGNLSAAFYLDVNGKELIVVNNHLETNSFSTEEKSQFSDMVKGGMGGREIKTESKFILRKLGAAAAIRAPQADAVASFVRMHKGRSMIVCGDYNDIPLSYARRTIAKDLVDCYVSTATGPGFTYHRNGMYVRIDNVMCTDDLEPYNFSVETKCNLSDHYPVVGWVKWHGR